MLLAWLTGIATLVLFAGISIYLKDLRPNILALQLSFTRGSFLSIVEVWSTDMKYRYRQHLSVDFLLLLTYGAFGYFLSTQSDLFLNFNPFVQKATTWMLPFAAVFDALENFLHIRLLSTTPPTSSLPYTIAGTGSSVKWLLLIIFGIVTAYAFIQVNS